MRLTNHRFEWLIGLIVIGLVVLGVLLYCRTETFYADDTLQITVQSGEIQIQVYPDIDNYVLFITPERAYVMDCWGNERPVSRQALQFEVREMLTRIQTRLNLDGE